MSENSLDNNYRLINRLIGKPARSSNLSFYLFCSLVILTPLRNLYLAPILCHNWVSAWDLSRFCAVGTTLLNSLLPFIKCSHLINGKCLENKILHFWGSCCIKHFEMITRNVEHLCFLKLKLKSTQKQITFSLYKIDRFSALCLFGNN